jgi:soluble lytic murein transglycosylase-like protein
VIDKIVAYAPQYGVDTRLALAIVRCESNFNACAVGPTKDVGVFQFIPKTWRYVGAEDKGLSRFDADANIRYGLALLRNEGPRHWMCYTRGMI